LVSHAQALPLGVGVRFELLQFGVDDVYHRKIVPCSLVALCCDKVEPSQLFEHPHLLRVLVERRRTLGDFFVDTIPHVGLPAKNHGSWQPAWSWYLSDKVAFEPKVSSSGPFDDFSLSESGLGHTRFGARVPLSYPSEFFSCEEFVDSPDVKQVQNTFWDDLYVEDRFCRP